MPIRRHECCFAHKVAMIEGATIELNRASGLLEAGQCAQSLGLAVARHTGYPNDLAPQHVKAHIRESLAAKRLDRKVDVVRDILRLLRERRAQRSPDDHA